MCLSLGGEDYGDALENSSDEGDAPAGPIDPDTGMPGPLLGLRASSMGCREEQAWKESLWDVVPAPPDESDSDEDMDEDGNDDEFGGSGDEEGDMRMSDEGDARAGEAARESFRRIVADMVLTGHTDGHAPDNLLMEIKGLKFAENKEFSDCIYGTVPTLIDIAVKSVTSSAAPTMSALVGALKTMFSKDSRWGLPLLRALVQGPEDEIAVLEAAEGKVLEASSKRLLYPIFRFIIQMCYDAELVTEEAFEIWISQRRAPSAPRDCRLPVKDNWGERLELFNEPRVQEFVEWLNASEDESDDEDDEESGSSEEG